MSAVKSEKEMALAGYSRVYGRAGVSWYLGKQQKYFNAHLDEVTPDGVITVKAATPSDAEPAKKQSGPFTETGESSAKKQESKQDEQAATTQSTVTIGAPVSDQAPAAETKPKGTSPIEDAEKAVSTLEAELAAAADADTSSAVKKKLSTARRKLTTLKKAADSQ